MALGDRCAEQEEVNGVVPLEGSARRQQLEAEIAKLCRRHRNLSATRLQRCWRATWWRQHLLPRQLRRVRILLRSCCAIQCAWRGAATRRRAAAAVTPSEGVGIAPPRAAVEISWRDGPELDLGLPGLGPGALRAAALWRGCKLRRALAGRGVQTKLQLRRDLYLLISDVEGRQGIVNSEQVTSATQEQESQRLGPWLDVLYTGLARLQQEALQELSDALRPGPGTTRRLFFGFGAASSSLPLSRCAPGSPWRGWPRDLRRMPWLAIRPRDRPGEEDATSPLANEPSLMASTSRWQDFSPPNSPLLTAEARSESILRRARRQSPATSGLEPHDRVALALRTATLSGLVPPASGEASGGMQGAAPPRQSSLQIPTPTKDWSQVRPRVRCWDTPPSSCRGPLSVGSSTAASSSAPLGLSFSGGSSVSGNPATRGRSPVVEPSLRGRFEMAAAQTSFVERGEQKQGLGLRKTPWDVKSPGSLGRTRPGHLSVSLSDPQLDHAELAGAGSPIAAGASNSTNNNNNKNSTNNSNKNNNNSNSTPPGFSQDSLRASAAQAQSDADDEVRSATAQGEARTENNNNNKNHNNNNNNNNNSNNNNNNNLGNMTLASLLASSSEGEEEEEEEESFIGVEENPEFAAALAAAAEARAGASALAPAVPWPARAGAMGSRGLSSDSPRVPDAGPGEAWTSEAMLRFEVPSAVEAKWWPSAAEAT
ncbi:unnamed protein product [Polarella glacialis]|uniref:Uncharacterized protein n=1 Tax=Polarella glacialis TaxID=89957 RepID=A0A813EH68_POLGL|nr:unnamed protein product [Polarella glacialis]